MASIIERLAVTALLPRDELTSLIRSAPHRYKEYLIPKRKPGEFRKIAQPAKEVKALQYWAMENVLKKFEVHPSATAYRRGRSILSNARPHRRSRFVLKMDFKDFFPSIKAKDFRRYLKREDIQLDSESVEALCRILFWMPKGTRDLCLSIGAPTSPMLSNILMLDFDLHVSRVCKARNVAYTRYADDLTFSANTSNQLALIEKEVVGYCSRHKSPTLTINEEKTARVSKREARRVTGLIITNDQKVSLGRDQKRKIRAWVHHFVTNQLSDADVLRLRGMLNYVNSVEPTFLIRLGEKYGATIIGGLRRG